MNKILRNLTILIFSTLNIVTFTMDIVIINDYTESVNLTYQKTKKNVPSGRVSAYRYFTSYGRRVDVKQPEKTITIKAGNAVALESKSLMPITEIYFISSKYLIKFGTRYHYIEATELEPTPQKYGTKECIVIRLSRNTEQRYEIFKLSFTTEGNPWKKHPLAENIYKINNDLEDTYRDIMQKRNLIKDTRKEYREIIGEISFGSKLSELLNKLSKKKPPEEKDLPERKDYMKKNYFQ